MQEPVLWGEQSVLTPCGLGHSGGRALPAPLPTRLGSAGTCLAGVCVSIRAREHVCGPYVTPWLWRATGLSPGRAWPPGGTGAHQGPASLPQPKSSFEQSKKEAQRLAAPGAPAEGLPPSRQEQEVEKQAALNKGTAPRSARPAPTDSSILLGPCPWSPGQRSAGCFGLLCSGHRPPQDQVSGRGGGGAHGRRAQEEHWWHGQRAQLSGRACVEGLGAGVLGLG